MKQKYANILTWPGATINNATYRGNMDENDLIEVKFLNFIIILKAICASMVDPDQLCIDFLQNKNTAKKPTGETT